MRNDHGVGGRASRVVSAFTLLEAVMAAAVLCLVALALYGIMSSTSTSYQAVASRAAVEEAARRALDEMAAELRIADAATLALSQHNGSDRVIFRIPTDVSGKVVAWSDYIQYRWEPASADGSAVAATDAGFLARLEGASMRRVAGHVAAGGVSITRAGSQLTLGLRLTAPDGQGRMVQAHIQTVVTIRNSSRP